MSGERGRGRTRARDSGTVRIHRAVGARELRTERARRAVATALRQGGRPDLRLDVVLLDDARIAELHARFLGDPRPTDVLAFDLGASEDDGPDAEIYVSVECARRVAGARGAPVARELALYLVHGALHLCGYDDHRAEDRRSMREAESRVMEELGYAAEHLPHDHGA